MNNVYSISEYKYVSCAPQCAAVSGAFRFCGKQSVFISIPKKGEEAEFIEQWIPNGENHSFID